MCNQIPIQTLLLISNTVAYMSRWLPKPWQLYLLHIIFLTLFSVFGNHDETLSLVFVMKWELQNYEWYRSNGMIVNETKHQAIVVGKTDHSFSFPLKDLLDIFGINIDNKLHFDNYISTICKKINGQFNVMLRFLNLISKDTLLRLYKAFIMPHFS